MTQNKIFLKIFFSTILEQQGREQWFTKLFQTPVTTHCNAFQTFNQNLHYKSEACTLNLPCRFKFSFYHTYIHIYMLTEINLHAHTHIYVHIYMHTLTYTHIYICTILKHTYIHTHYLACHIYI